MAVHGAAAIAGFMGLQGVALLVVLGGTSISAGYWVSHAMRWIGKHLVQIDFFPDFSANWLDCHGCWHNGARVKVAWCSGYFLLLGLIDVDQPRFWVAFAPDSSDPDTLRLLRVWARWGHGTPDK